MSEVQQELVHKTTLFDNGVDLNEKRIYLFGAVNDPITHAIVKGIHLFNSDLYDTEDPIELWISSEGGSISDMFAIYDAIRKSETPVHTIATGMCCSAAVLLLACGHKRYATENTWLMEHSMKSMAEGSESEMRASAAASKRMLDATHNLLAKHSKKTAKAWEKFIRDEGEVWLDAQQMKEWGIIDSVIENPPIKSLVKRRVKKVSTEIKLVSTSDLLVNESFKKKE